MKFQVVGVRYATTVVTVEADTVAEAIDRAQDEDLYPTICHQCSRNVELGDAAHVVVIDDEKSEEVYTDEEPRLHLATVAQLEAELRKRRA